MPNRIFDGALPGGVTYSTSIRGIGWNLRGRPGMALLILIIACAFTFSSVLSSISLIEGAISPIWPSTTGTVTISEARWSRPSYDVRVHYQYSVNGQLYTAKQVRSVNLFSKDKEWVQSIVSRYPKGSQVTVYYNPLLPMRAVLEQGLLLDWALRGLGVTVLMGGIAFFCWWLLFNTARAMRPQPPNSEEDTDSSGIQVF